MSKPTALQEIELHSPALPRTLPSGYHYQKYLFVCKKLELYLAQRWTVFDIIKNDS